MLRSAQIDTIEDQLQRLWIELEFLLAAAACLDGQLNAALFQSFCRDPKSSSIEVEQLDSVAAFVGEHEQRFAGQERVSSNCWQTMS